MTNEPIRRNRYAFNNRECLDEGGRFFNQDFDEFHLPSSRVQLSSLHDWGVAQGLEVSGTVGGTTLTINPGVAIDASGNLISLSSDGSGSTGDTDPIQTSVPIEIGVESLQPVAETTYYLTLEFNELEQRESGHPCDRVLEQSPWARLRPVAGDTPFVDDGAAVILAQVVINTGGQIAQISTAGRRLVGKTVEHLNVVRSETADDQVSQVPSGQIGPNKSGGLQITVPAPSDRIALAQTSGGNFEELSIQANTAHFNGNVNIEQALGITGEVVLQSTLSVSGSAQFESNLTIGGNLEVQGEVIARDTEHIAGNVALGDEDGDEIRVAGVLRSGHSSGALQIDDAVQATGPLAITNGLSIGNPPASNYRFDLEGGDTRLGGALTVQKNAIAEGENDFHLELYSPNSGSAANYTKLRFHQGNQYWAWLGYHGTAQNTAGEFVFWNLNQGREAAVRAGTVTADQFVGNGAVVRGMIMMWSGAANNIPTGWALCDGRNSTPDLRDRFIVGAGNRYRENARGGADTVQLNVNQIPSHGHSASVNPAGNHHHEMKFDTGGGGSFGGAARMAKTREGLQRNVLANYEAPTNSGGNHSHSVSVRPAGGNQAHENRPPYYALSFIMKL